MRLTPGATTLYFGDDPEVRRILEVGSADKGQLRSYKPAPAAITPYFGADPDLRRIPRICSADRG
ncbi:hypothetical protein GCM10010910_18840 [Microbacterium nanhaiense]|uniref:Uncharacterized protein n=1 Tax=Microbacterium nanhaiense TaxID=1301026 RepID=A0ABQ2N623_9MICO|nr:hypothetical protein GCM10010910_18840 [Microbacterium nanhaiense]